MIKYNSTIYRKREDEEKMESESKYKEGKRESTPQINQLSITKRIGNLCFLGR